MDDLGGFPIIFGSTPISYPLFLVSVVSAENSARLPKVVNPWMVGFVWKPIGVNETVETRNG